MRSHPRLPSRPIRLPLAWLLAGVAGVLATLAVTTPAAAHAELTGSNPRDGATVTTAPTAITLSFGEELNPTAVQIAVTGENGRKVTSKAAEVLGSGIRQKVTLPGPGRYTIAYRVVSADGHPVQGSVSFTIAGATPSAPAGTATPGTSPSTGPSEASPSSSAGPATASADTSPAAKAGDSDSGKSKVWPWIVIGAVLVVLAGIAVALATGGRPRSKADGPADT